MHHPPIYSIVCADSISISAKFYLPPGCGLGTDRQSVNASVESDASIIHICDRDNLAGRHVFRYIDN